MEYFSLPADFLTNATATIVSIVGIVLAARALPVVYKYVVQIFGKKSS